MKQFNFHNRLLGWKQIVCFASAALLFACSEGNKTSNVIGDFSVVDTLSGVGIEELNKYPGTYAVGVVGDKYLFDRMSDYFLYVTDTAFQNAKEIAAMGHGAGEYEVPPYYLGQYEEQGDEVYAYLADRDTKEILAQPLSGTAPYRSVAKIEGKDVGFIRFMFAIDSTHIVAAKDEGACDIFGYDVATGAVSLFEQTPFIAEYKDEGSRLQNIAAISPERTRIASAFFALPILNIYSNSGSLVKSVNLENEEAISERLKTLNADDGESVDYFQCLTTTSKYLYALYNNAETNSSSKNQILVFDWEGKPVRKLIVDKALHFAVDEQRGIIIAVNEDDSEYVCTKYALPHL